MGVISVKYLFPQMVNVKSYKHDGGTLSSNMELYQMIFNLKTQINCILIQWSPHCTPKQLELKMCYS
ncbi:hypothetical protein RIR_jg5205.t1 [Rhizophagus irregularis DAOM 181602=DAOM 197198]|nr:hypothetical protein RIR_jg5205.t1 [Rhizophagus irregularis DAOM 181602=DAOM 197198]